MIGTRTGLNKPVKYSDPTGHNYCDLINNNNAEDCNAGEKWIASHSYKRKQDNVELTWNGHAAQELYRLYFRTPGSWINNGMSEFTIEQFLGLIAEYDISAEKAATSPITEVMGRQIWTDATASSGHAPYCTGDVCQNGALNFIGGYINSAKLRFSLTSINPNDVPFDRTTADAISTADKRRSSASSSCSMDAI